MPPSSSFPAEGGCDCGTVRYRMESSPLFVHCCHCRWCQRESGASFALNALIEADRVTELGQSPEYVHTPTASGKGQRIARCPICKVAVWSNYAGTGPLVKFIRVGTLDNPDLLPPDIHILRPPSNPGSFCLQVCLPSPSTTGARLIGHREAWRDAKFSCR